MNGLRMIVCLLSTVFVVIGAAYADVYTFKDGEEKTARLRSYEPPLMRLEYADDTGVDFPVTTHIAFDYDVETTSHPQKFISDYYRKANMLFEKGNTYYFRKDYRNAILQYDEALLMNPEHILAQLNKGSAHLMLSEYDQAIGVYAKLRRQEPKMGVPLAYIAYVYFCKEQFAQARAACLEALTYADVKADVTLSAALTRVKKTSEQRLFPR